ncbi:SDR family oxidoreductase [Microaerobacter geothermalis]|uniref:elongation factor P 5-aminopentanone reductase n=1 Tax=Microaerobacter geothermalis TaxID=674972 RepID=UPI001F3408DF|nr:SDR family oxidoreductase [Microaerobacter geothermalis]MCF6093160.1 SDR family oxidoreductase [Microaerobacter geothermalis]
MGKNCWALITGASRGIGRAIAEKLSVDGYSLYLHYHRGKKEIEEVSECCLSNGVTTKIIQADLRNYNGILEIEEQIKDNPPSILINNAGSSLYGLMTDVTKEQWDEMIHLHLQAPFFLIQAVSSSMIRAKFGRIVNISSVWGIHGAACEVVYSTVKGGLNTMTKALAKELAPSGITVNAIAPGVIETEMITLSFTSEEIADIVKEIPVGRMGRAEEIASLVSHLVSPNSSYITGQIISVNGGWYL